MFAFTAARAQSVRDCDSIKDKKRRADCFESVARALSDEKKRNDDLAALVARGKIEATRDFFDPDAARFRDLELRESGKSRELCGTVNGKNRLGGFVGYRRFIVSYDKDAKAFTQIQLEDVELKTPLARAHAEMFNISWDLYCKEFALIWRE